MCDIDPRDVETWNTKSSSHTGGGGSGENNGSNPGGVGNGGTGGDNTKPTGPIEPELGGGIGGYNLDNPEENK